MKRVLIITYYWPPAGGPGVQRWLKFVKYLRDFQIEPVVYVPGNPHYPMIDQGLETEVDEGITILKTDIREPYRFAKLLSRKKTKALSSGLISSKKPGWKEKLMLYVRGNFFIPDARVGWVKPSVKFLRNYLSEHEISTIVTSGPPHSLHLIGLKLKRQLNLPWMADFRDPWTSIHYHQSLRLTKSAQKKHKNLEREVLTNADHILVTSPSTKQEFEGITDRPISVITNGYDLTDEEQRLERDKKFSLAHIGSMLGERNPEVLWKVLSELCASNPEFKTSFELKLVGVVSQQVMNSLTKYGLKDHCEKLGYVEHQEAIKLQKESQLLLLVEIDRKETRAIIPGKVFEYLLAARPILALGPQGSDIKKIINDSGAGVYFNYSDAEAMKAQLLEWFELYREGKLELDSANIDRYNRRELTRELAAILHSL